MKSINEVNNKTLLIITLIIGFSTFIVFFNITVPVLNFLYKTEKEVIETPIDSRFVLYKGGYDGIIIADCGDDIDCFVPFAKNCDQAKIKNIEIIGEAKEGCLFYISGEESALCFMPKDQFIEMIEDWQKEKKISLEEAREQWCEDSFYQWQRSAF